MGLIVLCCLLWCLVLLGFGLRCVVRCESVLGNFGFECAIVRVGRAVLLAGVVGFWVDFWVWTVVWVICLVSWRLLDFCVITI